MLKSVKSRAEEQFAASKKKEKQFLNEKEKARLESAKKVARLRALRLAKEAADKEAADEAEAEKAAAKNKKISLVPGFSTRVIAAASVATQLYIDQPQSVSASHKIPIPDQPTIDRFG